MSQWYYTRNRQQNGPVSFEELKQIAANGGISPSDMVWNPPMPDWIPASSVQGLFNSSNPYATPATSFSDDPKATATGQVPVEIEPGSEPIDVGACIKRGIQLTNRNIGVLLLSVLLFFAITFALGVVLGGIQLAIHGLPTPPPPTSSLEAQLSYNIGEQQKQLWQLPFNLAASTFLSLGMLSVALNIVSGRRASVSQLFSQGGKFLKALGAMVLFIIATYIGLILLIVPGIYIMLRYGFFLTAITDKNLGIIESFKYSSQLTKNTKLPLLGLGVLCALMGILGVIACCVGILYAYPVALLAWVVAYRWLQYGHRIVQDQPGTEEPLLKI